MSNFSFSVDTAVYFVLPYKYDLTSLEIASDEAAQLADKVFYIKRAKTKRVK